MTYTEHNRQWVTSLIKVLSELRDEADRIIRDVESGKLTGEELEDTVDMFATVYMSEADDALGALVRDELPPRRTDRIRRIDIVKGARIKITNGIKIVDAEVEDVSHHDGYSYLKLVQRTDGFRWTVDAIHESYETWTVGTDEEESE